MKEYDKFKFDGKEYRLIKMKRRKNMFEKDHVTVELILFSLGCVFVAGATLMYLFKWLG